MFDSYIPTDYFKFHTNLLKFLLVWPLEKTNPLYRTQALCSLLAFSGISFFIISEAYYVTQNPSPEQIIFGVCSVLLHTCAVVFAVFVRIGKEYFLDCYKVLTELGDFYEYKTLDFVNFKVSKNKYLSHEEIMFKWRERSVLGEPNKEVTKIYEENMWHFRKYCFYFMLTYIVLVLVDFFGVYAGVFLYCLYYAAKHNLKREDVFYLPSESYFPFVYNANIYNYAFALFLQTIAGIYIILVLLVCITILVPIQVNTLYLIATIKDNIKHITKTTIVVDKRTEFLHKVQFFSCTEKIRRIFLKMAGIEDYFHKIFLFKYTIGVFSTCLSIMLFTSETNAFLHYCCLLSMAAQFVDPFVNCWLSQTLSDEIVSISSWIFNEVDWLSLSPSYRKDLSFNIFRLQKPISLTIGKFFAIDLNFFLNYVSKTYSLYTLISQSKQHKQH